MYNNLDNCILFYYLFHLKEWKKPFYYIYFYLHLFSSFKLNFGDIYIILSLNKTKEELKLGIKDFTGTFIHDNRNNFSLENLIVIKRIVSIKDLESEYSRIQVSKEFKRELYHYFGID